MSEELIKGKRSLQSERKLGGEGATREKSFSPKSESLGVEEGCVICLFVLVLIILILNSFYTT